MPAPRVTADPAERWRALLPNQDPIGKRMSFGFPPKEKSWREVRAGIVGRTFRAYVLVTHQNEPEPMIVALPYASRLLGSGMVARTTLSRRSAATRSAGCAKH